MKSHTMDLLCVEINSHHLKPLTDPDFLNDERVLQNLMMAEKKHTTTHNYFKCFQTELKPYMRKVVANWMLEVCEEESCKDTVFPLAMNLMDRFLSVVKIGKSQLQLLGCVCLFLASKMRQPRPVSVQKLIYYTDKSVTVDELMGWELLVLGRLKWDLASVIPNDFLNVLLRQLDKWSNGPDIQMLIKKHALTFISLCSSDFNLARVPPSMIATASIGAAIEGLTRINNNNLWNSTKPMLHQLHVITGIEMDLLRECQIQIEALMSPHIPSPISSSHMMCASSVHSNSHKSHSGLTRQDKINMNNSNNSLVAFE